MTSRFENDNSVEEVVLQLQSGTSMPVELLEIFSEEAEDHLRTIYDGLGRLHSGNDDQTALADVRRASHTLKGAAGAVGLQAATRLAHRMEDLLDQLAAQDAGVTEAQLKLLLATADQLQELTGEDIDVQTVAVQIAELYRGYSEQTGPSPAASDEATRDRIPAGANHNEQILTGLTPSPSFVVDQSGCDRNAEKSTNAETGKPTQYLRVPLERLDEMVSLMGEMIVNRSQFEHRLSDFESRIEDMQSALGRLRDVARHVEIHSERSALMGCGTIGSTDMHRSVHSDRARDEFDSLEFDQYTDFDVLARTLAEAENDAELMSSEFRKVKTTFDGLLRTQKQLNQKAQQSLMRIRMVPFSGIVSRLERTARTVSNKLGRPVELKITGERIELDKTVLDQITDPLLHLIRNAIDHGVEPAEIRAAAGKPETAQLCLKVVNHGTQVTIQISDDGAGINLEKVRDKATERGLLEADQEISDEELRSLIFQPGFSTAAQLTDVSGRGVGMDVVGDAIRRLKGKIRVDSEFSEGTTFTIQLPTTLGVTRAVLVECSGRTFAIPMQSIQKTARLDPFAVSRGGENSHVFLGGRDLRLLDLAAHLQLKTESDSFDRAAPVLVLGNGTTEVAVTVDFITASQDIVVKTLGDHLTNVPGIIGATISGDGSVIPILDPEDLIEPNRTAPLAVNTRGEAVPVARRTLAMVIDDSISVRRVTGQLLTNSGWDVVAAKDGVDALEQLAELDRAPDIFLTDMEMPRMDGLELIRQIREQPEFETTPIVMITSRASEKHRHKAFAAGASDYVIKPFNDESLLSLIGRLVESARESV